MGMQVEEFLRTRLPRLLRTATLLTGRRADAEDLVQDVLATVVLKWRTVGAADDVDAYVRRMLVNTWISRCRKASSKELVDHDVVVSDTRAPSQPDPARQVVDGQVLWDAVCGLPPRQRAAVVLRFYEDLPDVRAAEALGCSPGRSASWCTAASPPCASRPACTRRSTRPSRRARRARDRTDHRRPATTLSLGGAAMTTDLRTRDPGPELPGLVETLELAADQPFDLGAVLAGVDDRVLVLRRRRRQLLAVAASVAAVGVVGATTWLLGPGRDLGQVATPTPPATAAPAPTAVVEPTSDPATSAATSEVAYAIPETAVLTAEQVGGGRQVTFDTADYANQPVASGQYCDAGDRGHRRRHRSPDGSAPGTSRPRTSTGRSTWWSPAGRRARVRRRSPTSPPTPGAACWLDPVTEVAAPSWHGDDVFLASTTPVLGSAKAIAVQRVGRPARRGHGVQRRRRRRRAGRGAAGERPGRRRAGRLRPARHRPLTSATLGSCPARTVPAAAAARPRVPRRTRSTPAARSRACSGTRSTPTATGSCGT